MNSIASIAAVAGRTQPVTVDRLRRELLIAQVRSTIRREALVEYVLKLAATGLAILLAAFLVQLGNVLGRPLVLSDRTIDIVWLSSVVTAAAATLVTSVAWWQTRLVRLRGELSALELRFQLDRTDAFEADDHPA